MSGDFTNAALREVLQQVERDEAVAIETLCAVLGKIEESRQIKCLAGVRAVVKEWQNRPPGAIVTELQKISKELECPTSAKA